MNKMMHKWLAMLMALLMMLSACPLALAEAVESAVAEPEAEAAVVEETSAANETKPWTVMVYLCGTDLESRGGMATINLVEMAETIPNENINVVVETGGTRTWQTEEQLGLKIANDKLQRWSFGVEGYQLVEEQPLANMADYRTLTDFVQWSAKNYPAEKYLLVMWDHGGGSNGGLIVDQLHNNAIMSLEDFGKGLANSGVHMEAILLDTCLMATLETAQAVQPYANYLIASEETVPGQGTDYQQWLQYLYDFPYVDGRQFGKTMCDGVQQKYAEINMDYFSKTLTYSAIDLKKLDAVVAAFENMFVEVGQLLTDPVAFGRFTYLTQNAESFTYSEIVDLQDFATRAMRYGLKVETVGAVIESVNDAVVHDVKGILHSYSHGLAFWYDPNASEAALDHFARNCKNPNYLAFLDAINMGWTAPDWVYEKVERLPDISREDYIVTSEVKENSDGHLQLSITNAKDAVARVDYRLYMASDKVPSGYISLGLDDEIDGDWEEGTFWDTFDGTWPMIGNVPCEIDMVNSTSSYTLYNVPVGIPVDEKHPSLGYEKYDLRVGYEYDKPLTSVFDNMYQTASEKAQAAVEGETEEKDPYAGEYVIYGLWNQDSSNIGLPSRDVMDVDSLYGKTFTVLATGMDPLMHETEGQVAMGKFVMSEDLVIEEKPLPQGDYAYEFVITTVFGNQKSTMFVPFKWDGKKATYDFESYETLKFLLEFLGMEF